MKKMLQKIADIFSKWQKKMFYKPEYYKYKHSGRLRNKPCKCGSGKKFKYCCWDVIGF